MDNIVCKNGQPDTRRRFSAGSVNKSKGCRLQILAMMAFLGLSALLQSSYAFANGVIVTRTSAADSGTAREVSNTAGSSIQGTNSPKLLTSNTRKIEVSIAAGHAVTTVEQTFTNLADLPLESYYQTQLPKHSTVSQFTVWVDNERTKAQVFPQKSTSEFKQQQTRAYTGVSSEADRLTYDLFAGSLDGGGNFYSVKPEQPEWRGRDPVDTENLKFSIKLTSASSFKEITTRLVYIQTVTVDNGVGSFAYPIGHKSSAMHSLHNGPANEFANRLPYQSQSQSQTINEDQEHFTFDLSLHSTAPVSGIHLPGFMHSQVRKMGTDEWQVSLTNHHDTNANKNEILQLETNSIDSSSDCHREQKTPARYQAESILVLWCLETDKDVSMDLTTFTSHDVSDSNLATANATSHIAGVEKREKGTFVVTLAPQGDLAPLQSGRDWVFVLDSSSSMQDKFTILTKSIETALLNLTAGDRFRIIRFNNSTSELTTGWQKPDRDNIKYWKSQLQNTQASGGTNLYAGVELGYEMLEPTRTSAMVLITDGEANIGTVEKKAFLALMKKVDVRLFTAVVGERTQQPQLKQMAQRSNGLAVSLPRVGKLPDQLIEFTRHVTHESLYDINVEITGGTGFNLTADHATTLYRGDHLTLMGQFELPVQKSQTVTVIFNGLVGGKTQTYRQRFSVTRQHKFNRNIAAIKAWADIQAIQSKVDYLGDDSEHKQTMQTVALAHGLATKYTRMVLKSKPALAMAAATNDQSGYLEMSQQSHQSTQQPTPAALNPVHGGGAAGLLLLMALPGLQFVRRRLAGTIHEGFASRVRLAKQIARSSEIRSCSTG